MAKFTIFFAIISWRYSHFFPTIVKKIPAFLLRFFFRKPPFLPLIFGKIRIFCCDPLIKFTSFNVILWQNWHFFIEILRWNSCFFYDLLTKFAFLSPSFCEICFFLSRSFNEIRIFSTILWRYLFSFATDWRKWFSLGLSSKFGKVLRNHFERRINPVKNHAKLKNRCRNLEKTIETKDFNG